MSVSGGGLAYFTSPWRSPCAQVINFFARPGVTFKSTPPWAKAAFMVRATSLSRSQPRPPFKFFKEDPIYAWAISAIREARRRRCASMIQRGDLLLFSPSLR